MAHILVVEDDDATRLLFEAVLRRHGLQCTAVEDGERAIESLLRVPYDGVLLDLVLPRINGLDVLRHIAGTRPELVPRVIVCTALPRHQITSLDELRDVGGVFFKPSDIFEVAAAVVSVSRGPVRSLASAPRNTRTTPLRSPDDRES